MKPTTALTPAMQRALRMLLERGGRGYTDALKIRNSTINALVSRLLIRRVDRYWSIYEITDAGKAELSKQ